VFYKYEFILPAIKQMITYSVGNRQHSFYTPDFNQRWNMLFYSCNGICSVTPEVQQQYNDIKPLWVDVNRMHSQVQFHGMIGGGDQIYCDDVFNLVCFESWCGMRDKAKRMMQEFSPEMNRDTEAYYFNNYMTHFGKDGFREALATIPFNFTWDDHDIFDGYGSYPLYLQTSLVFKGIFHVALRFYLLFQQHTNAHLYRFEDIGHKSHSSLRLYGPRLAVISPDVRSERTLEVVIPEPSWKLIWEELDALPNSFEHLIVNATIPLAYPRIKGEQVFSLAKSAAKGTRNFLNKLQDLTLGKSGSLDGKTWAEAFCKTGAFQKVVNGFGEPELLDDLNDHWTNEAHGPEREKFIKRLQQFATEKRIRVSLLSGDVHVGGAAMFRGRNGGSWEEKKRDPRFMIQMISSAIGNVPPPFAIIKHLHMSAKPIDFDAETVEEMYPIFKDGLDGSPTTEKYSKLI
jgi:hypothetical protein